MKYICLGYIERAKFENMSQNKRHAMLDEYCDYDDKLRANGHLVAGEALQPPDAAMTLYWKNGKVAVTDVPYAETKEQLGGILMLETRSESRRSVYRSIPRSSMDSGRYVRLRI